MRKSLMAVVLMLGVLLVVGADAPASQKLTDSLGEAISLIPTHPQKAEAMLTSSDAPLALAWRIYVVFTAHPKSTERQTLLDELATQLTIRLEWKYQYLSGHIHSIDDVLEHLMATYIHEDVQTRPCTPLWIFQRHPQAMKATWVEFNATGINASSRFVRICRTPEDQNLFTLPEVKAFEKHLKLMDDIAYVCRGTMDRLYGRLYNDWKTQVGINVDHALNPDPFIGKFIALWANKGIWEKTKVQKYNELRFKTITALAAWLIEHQSLSPEEAERYATLIANGIADHIVGRYSKTLLKAMKAPWYTYAASTQNSTDGLTSVLPNKKSELDYMLHVSILNQQPLDMIRALHKAGATLENAPENETILAIYDADYLKQILALGISVDHTNKFGKTALGYAAQLGYLDSAKVLLAHGADVNKATIPLKDYGNWREEHPFWRSGCHRVAGGKTPLMYACEQGSLAMVELLLKHGSDPIKQMEGKSPEDIIKRWDRLLSKNEVMTADEKAQARALLFPH